MPGGAVLCCTAVLPVVACRVCRRGSVPGRPLLPRVAPSVPAAPCLAARYCPLLPTRRRAIACCASNASSHRAPLRVVPSRTKLPPRHAVLRLAPCPLPVGVAPWSCSRSASWTPLSAANASVRLLSEPPMPNRNRADAVVKDLILLQLVLLSSKPATQHGQCWARARTPPPQRCSLGNCQRPTPNAQRLGLVSVLVDANGGPLE